MGCTCTAGGTRPGAGAGWLMSRLHTLLGALLLSGHSASAFANTRSPCWAWLCCSRCREVSHLLNSLSRAANKQLPTNSSFSSDLCWKCHASEGSWLFLLSFPFQQCRLAQPHWANLLSLQAEESCLFLICWEESEAGFLAPCWQPSPSHCEITLL